MKYSVSRENNIGAARSNVIKYVADLNNWAQWSPWACLDPQASVKSETKYLAWESRFTGSGTMQITHATDSSVDMDLSFIKPFKSQAKVRFKLKQVTPEETQVIWNMHSRLPFIMCFFKKLFQVMIGRDFERGLVRLKYLAETGSIPCRLEYIDTPEPVAEFKVAGISAVCHMSKIAENMQEVFTRLHTLVNTANLTPSGVVCFCDKVQLSRQIMHYTAAAIYTGNDARTPELNQRNIPAHKAIKVVLHGSYDFMGDAWSGAYAHLRGLKLKADKRVPPYEIYIKGPHNSGNPAEYVTEIRMPVR